MTLLIHHQFQQNGKTSCNMGGYYVIIFNVVYRAVRRISTAYVINIVKIPIDLGAAVAMDIRDRLITK